MDDVGDELEVERLAGRNTYVLRRLAELDRLEPALEGLLTATCKSTLAHVASWLS